MSEKQKNWDDVWLVMGPIIAFSIVGMVVGGVIGDNWGKSILSLIAGLIIGIVGGFVIGAMIGGFLASLFENEVETSSRTRDSQEWKKLADKLVEIMKDNNGSYTILESKQEDDFETIKNNYRRLVRQYHPDFLGTNASEAMHKYAKEMSQKINEAFEIVKKQRGIK